MPVSSSTLIVARASARQIGDGVSSGRRVSSRSSPLRRIYSLPAPRQHARRCRRVRWQTHRRQGVPFAARALHKLPPLRGRSPPSDDSDEASPISAASRAPERDRWSSASYVYVNITTICRGSLRDGDVGQKWYLSIAIRVCQPPHARSSTEAVLALAQVPLSSNSRSHRCTTLRPRN